MDFFEKLQILLTVLGPLCSFFGVVLMDLTHTGCADYKTGRRMRFWGVMAFLAGCVVWLAR